MRYRFWILVLGLACVIPVSGQTSLALKNNLAIVRTDEPVVISRKVIEMLCGTVNPGEVPVLKMRDGTNIPAQTDDLDGDGQWDEMAFEITIGARSTLILDIYRMAESRAPEFVQKTQVYLGEQNPDGSFSEVQQAEAPPGLAGFPTRYQSEGVGWENDRIAFRVYFDCRNVKDLFGKLIPGLILQKAGAGEWTNYHNLAPWGMDILHCASSLGAGGLALIDNDSLFRLGSTAVYQYRQITEGPVRTIFELRYAGWKVRDQDYKAVERITLWAGKYWFQSDVTVTGFTGEKELATGIVTTKLDRDPVQFQADNRYTAILTHGKQSLNNDILAMAVLAPTGEVGKISRTGSTDFYKLGYQTVPVKSFSQIISETYYISQKIKSGTASTHYFFAMWGLENPKWNELAATQDYIRTEAAKLSNAMIDYKKTVH